MKLTHETLRDLYLKDLELPDTHHGRTTPKVRYPEQWKNIVPFLANGTALTIDLAALTDRDVWVWSDQHFGHNNIIEYAERPFLDVNSMNDALFKTT